MPHYYKNSPFNTHMKKGTVCYTVSFLWMMAVAPGLQVRHMAFHLDSNYTLAEENTTR